MVPNLVHFRSDQQISETAFGGHTFDGKLMARAAEGQAAVWRARKQTSMKVAVLLIKNEQPRLTRHPRPCRTTRQVRLSTWHSNIRRVAVRMREDWWHIGHHGERPGFTEARKSTGAVGAEFCTILAVGDDDQSAGDTKKPATGSRVRDRESQRDVASSGGAYAAC